MAGGGASSVAMPAIGAQMAKATAEGRASLQGVARRVVMAGRGAVVVLLVTGPLLYWLKWNFTAPSMMWFGIKMLFVLVLVVAMIVGGIAMKRAAGLFRMASGGSSFASPEPYWEIESVGSPEALVKEFVEHPTIFWRQSEMSMIFVTMNQKGTKNLRERLIQLWDTPDMVRNLVVNKESRGEAAAPFLTLIGGIQPGRLAETPHTMR